MGNMNRGRPRCSACAQLASCSSLNHQPSGSSTAGGAHVPVGEWGSVTVTARQGLLEKSE